ncbi:MAG: AAA family ATPase [Reyranellaceae bacterium]
MTAIIPYNPGDERAKANGAANDGIVTATPYRWIDPSSIPPRQWLFERHYIRGFVSCTVSASGVGKSSLALLDAVSMASGRNLLTGAAIPARRVWYWNGEDPREELERRVQAICLHYGLTEADLGGRLFLDSGREKRIKVAIDDRRHGITINRPLVASTIETLRHNEIDVLILDPFVSTHGVPENDNGAIDQVATELADIADATNCAVEVVHHVRKTNGAEITAEDARGAVSLIAKARSVRVLNPMTEEEALKANINPAERRMYFRVDPSAKANMAPPTAAAWRRMASVSLGNGTGSYPADEVGVVTTWEWPDVFAGLTSDDLKAVQNKVASGTWRADARADEWVGKAVAEALDLDLEDDGVRARIRSLLAGWLKSKALKETSRTDAKTRKDRKFVEVGTWAV